MIKDHLGNVRSLITEEQRVDKYPSATLEQQTVGTEAQYYDIVTANIATNPPGITAYTNNANGIGNVPSDPHRLGSCLHEP